MAMLLPSLGKKAAHRIATLFGSGSDGSTSALLTPVQEHELLALPRYVPGQFSTAVGELNYVDACTFVVCAREIFEQRCYDFAGSGELIIIDCGANIGLSSIWLALNYPGAVIEAYEADPSIHSALLRNISSLGLEDRVHAHNQAIWTHQNGISFFCEGGASGRAAETAHGNGALSAKQLVPSVTLAELLDRQAKIDLLKIDIEGAENHVLCDPAVDLSRVEHLFLEYHSFQDDPQMLPEILSLLKANGFRFSIKEARVVANPFTQSEVVDGMDFQLNIYAVRRAG
jgi:FkbM family methyltransferase